jgi:magnesium chelatase family protein
MVTFPCRFALIAAMNPCPCGFLDDRRRACHCRGIDIARYRSRLSGPLLDRFDMQVSMAPLTRKELVGSERGEPTAVVRQRVEQAREIQTQRYGSTLKTNASVPLPLLEASCRLTIDAKRCLGDIIEQLHLTGRGANRLVRVARTVADLAGNTVVTDVDIANALAFRFREDERTEQCMNTA